MCVTSESHPSANILIRLKLTEELRGLTPRALFYPIGETNGAYSMWASVSIDETPIAAILRYLCELTCFRLARVFALFLSNVIGGYKEHEPI